MEKVLIKRYDAIKKVWVKLVTPRTFYAPLLSSKNLL